MPKLKKDLKAEGKCVACKGKGVSSMGKPCIPCRGTGLKQESDIPFLRKNPRKPK